MAITGDARWLRKGDAARLEDQGGLSGLLGIQTVEVGDGYARVIATHKPHLTSGGRILHGAFYAVITDQAAAAACATVAKEGEGFSTIEYKVNLFRPITGGSVTAEARVLHKGQKTMVTNVEVRDEGKRLCAFKAVCVYGYYLRGFAWRCLTSKGY